MFFRVRPVGPGSDAPHEPGEPARQQHGKHTGLQTDDERHALRTVQIVGKPNRRLRNSRQLRQTARDALHPQHHLTVDTRQHERDGKRTTRLSG